MVQLTRTVDISDITPEEAAAIFVGMFADDQARFFAEVARIAKDWPGAGWCQQACVIAEHLTKDGREVVQTLAEHIALREPA